MRKFTAIPGKGIFAADDSSVNDDYIHVPDLWRRYGPTTTIVNVPMSRIVNAFNSSQIRGTSTNAKYMTVLLHHTLSGTTFDKLIFSNNLNECRREANKWLDSVPDKESTALWDEVRHWALIYDLESDIVVLYDDIDNNGYSLLKDWGYNNVDSGRQGDVDAATNIAAAEDTKRDIMELPTSERCALINQMRDESEAYFITNETAMKWFEDHGWDTSNYSQEQYDDDWSDYAKYYDEDEYDEDEYDEDDDSIDWIETRADARRWLNDKQREYGSTYFFPAEEQANLDKLVEKFGNTYFWDREALED